MIYLDNNATTRPDPHVLEVMAPFYREQWGNPSSLHRFGAAVREEIDKARQQVMLTLHASRPSEIIFTSGGTEANHLAILGTLAAVPEKNHCITTAVEHSSVSKVYERLSAEGKQICILPVNSQGLIDLKRLEESVTAKTGIVSVVWANNETGALQPIAEIAKICRKHGVPLHLDAVQAFGKVPAELSKINADLVTLSGHKFHAPKGVGALFVRKGHRIRPLLIGGGQEAGQRAGTENVAGIIAFGKAAKLGSQNLSQMEAVATLRNRLETEIISMSSRAKISAAQTPRLPNTSHICFDGYNGEEICLLLSEAGICVSTGSTCSAGNREPSPILKAMGIPAQTARGAVRFSLSRETTDEEIEIVLQRLSDILKRLNSHSFVRHFRSHSPPL